MQREALASHLLVEYYGCDKEILNDPVKLEEIMSRAAEIAQTTIIKTIFHSFSQTGVSGVVVVQESHLSAHTWPDDPRRVALMDIFVCGEQSLPWEAHKYLIKALGAAQYSVMEVMRGSLDACSSVQEAVSIHQGIPHDSKPGAVEKVRELWFTEVHGSGTAFSIVHDGLLFYQQSLYQSVKIFKSRKYGNFMVLGDKTMCAELPCGEAAYHEMLVHVPMLMHLLVMNRPMRVLIIGGGDGGAAREVLKYGSVYDLYVDIVEIDQVVIDAAKKFLPGLAESFNHPRLKLTVGDGKKFIAYTPDDYYDVVLLDLTDPIGPAEHLFNEDFYRDVYRILNQDGILVSQSESPYFNKSTFIDINRCWRKIFGKTSTGEERVYPYRFAMETYPSGDWSATMANKGGVVPISCINHEVVAKLGSLDYYSPKIHQAAFVMPAWVERELQTL